MAFISRDSSLQRQVRFRINPNRPDADARDYFVVTVTTIRILGIPIWRWTNHREEIPLWALNEMSAYGHTSWRPRFA